jgi:molecular chaperone DnaJ
LNKDLYQVLGVPKTASADDIKQAHRKLVRQYHPDANKEPGAEDKFKEVQSAYDVLSDPEKRRRYDGQGSHPFGDMFGDIFGGVQWGGGKYPRAGQNVVATVSVNLRDILQDKEVRVNLPTDEVCADCAGKGTKDGREAPTCDDCQGSGRINKYFEEQGHRTVQIQTCGRCRGTGTFIPPILKCEKCTNGKARTTREVGLKIRKGHQPEYQIRIGDLGLLGSNGGPRGQAFVQVKVEPFGPFRRLADRPNDIVMDLPLSFAQACLGVTVPVEMIDGTKCDINVSPGTQSGDTLRVPGQGVPSLENEGRGDLWVKFDVRVPKGVTAEQEELLHRFDEIERGKNA